MSQARAFEAPRPSILYPIHSDDKRRLRILLGGLTRLCPISVPLIGGIRRLFVPLAANMYLGIILNQPTSPRPVATQERGVPTRPRLSEGTLFLQLGTFRI
jgi:hypothetical protein